jgi:hypothetical protein
MRERDLLGNAALRLEDIPPPDAPWSVIQRFALTFDGYGHWGSFEKCADIANRGEPSSLTEWRTCLFFEQRRWRHFGEEPEGEALSHIRKLLEGIREKVSRGDSE